MQSRVPLEKVVSQLHAWREAERLSMEQISREAGVDLSSVYRLFDSRRRMVRYGSALKKICKFANIAIDPVTPDEFPVVVRDAVLETWDGTQRHAARLAAAVRAIGALLQESEMAGQAKSGKQTAQPEASVASPQ